GRLQSLPLCRCHGRGFLPPPPTPQLHARLRGLRVSTWRLSLGQHLLARGGGSRAVVLCRSTIARVWNGTANTPLDRVPGHTHLRGPSSAERGRGLHFGEGRPAGRGLRFL